jgi:NADPH:quinone reductase-like Zn-dependent oxidoreductase
MRVAPPRANAETVGAVRAAVLHEHGGTPQVDDFDDPREQSGCALVEVAAAGLHHLDLHKASGGFYTGPPPLPSVVGTDGVGRLEDGTRVYFDESVPPYGSMAERTLVPRDALLPVAEGVDDHVAAALGNTGLGGWLAVEWRSGLQPGETVLVLGAAGAVGSIAVQAARLLGAGRVIAADRPHERLHRLGADAVIELQAGEEDLAQRIADAAGGAVDVTIDMLWGAPAIAAMNAAARFARHVEVGNMAAPELTLAAPLIRSKSLDLRGFSVAHPSLELKRDAYLRLTGHAAAGDLVVDVDTRPLDHVADAWERQRQAAGGPKTVLVP